MNTKTTATLIARRVRGGANETESRALLADLVATFGPANLGYALHYNGFATASQADRLAAQLTA